MKARTSRTRLLKNGKLNRAFIDEPTPLVYRGRRVGSVLTDGTLDFPNHQMNWTEFSRAGDIENELKKYGANKVFLDGKVTAVVVRERR